MTLKSVIKSGKSFIVLITFLLMNMNVFAFTETFESITSFPSQDWGVHTFGNPDLLPEIDTSNGNPGHCYIPGGAGNALNTEIFNQLYMADYSEGLEMSCDFYFGSTNAHYTDLQIGLPRGVIQNGINLNYSVAMSMNSSAGVRSITCMIDSESPDHQEIFAVNDAFVAGQWYEAKIVIRKDQYVSFFVDDNLIVTTSKTIDPSYNMSHPILGGFNRNPVFADNFCVTNEISFPVICELYMPQLHYDSGDYLTLECKLNPTSVVPVDGRLVCMLEIAGALYFYPEWKQFSWMDLLITNKEEWSVAMTVLDDTSEIIIEPFQVSFYPFEIHGTFMATFTDPGMTRLLSNVDSLEWSVGGGNL